jgi:hypothetical protein
MTDLATGRRATFRGPSPTRARPPAPRANVFVRRPRWAQLRALAEGSGLLGRFSYLVLTQVVVVVLGIG